MSERSISYVHIDSKVSLSLGANALGDEGARHLREVLDTNSALRELILWRNEIGPDGVRPLADALTRNQTLTSLDLYENRLGDDGAQMLAVALRQNSTLTFLDLDGGNAIGHNGIDSWRAALDYNVTLCDLRGVGSDDLLKRNAGTRLARKEQVVPLFALKFLVVLLSVFFSFLHLHSISSVCSVFVL